MNEVLFDAPEVIVHGAPGRLRVPGLNRVDHRTMLLGSLFHPSRATDAKVPHAGDQGFHLQEEFEEPAIPRHQEEMAVDSMVGGNPTFRVLSFSARLHLLHPLLQFRHVFRGTFGARQFGSQALECSVCLFQVANILDGQNRDGHTACPCFCETFIHQTLERLSNGGAAHLKSGGKGLLS
jgi:hypothetical protein